MTTKPSRTPGVKRRGSTPARIASAAIIDGAFLQRTAHLLKNHVTAVQTASHLLLQPAAPVDESVRVRWRNALRDSGAGMIGLLEQLEKLGDSLRRDPAGVSNVTLAEWMDEQLRVARTQEPAGRVELSAGRRPGGVWRFATAPAALALGCLLRNALVHPFTGARASLSGRAVPGGLLLVVADDGAGVPAGEVSRLFTPFFRGEAACDLPGAGLGLAVARAAAARAGGSITYRRASPCGARFELFVRASRPARA